MLEYDRARWPGGVMTGYILWIAARWADWCTARGFKNQDVAALVLGDQMHPNFDAWLAEEIP
jgi:hypothetical protein